MPIVDMSKEDAALYWHRFGYKIIPVTLRKKTAVKWDHWLKNLSAESIKDHWAAKSFHDVGFILGPHNLVLDADTPEAIQALEQLESKHGVRSNLIVKTSRGVHHHFRIKAGIKVKSNCHGTDKYPTRIDVKANRSMVILPPSTGKTLERREVSKASELTKVGQEFIDAIYRHNDQVPLPTRTVLAFQ